MKKVLSVLLTIIMLLSVVSTVSAVEVTDNQAETPIELTTRYEKTKFNLVDLGTVEEYELYYNVTGCYTYMDYDVVLGYYVFDCLAQQYPYDLGLYVVGNGSAYTLKEACDENLVDMDTVVSLIGSQKDNIHYNFAIRESSEKIFIKYLKDKNMYDENTYKFKYLAQLEGYDICYGYGIFEPVEGGTITIGDYNIWAPATTPFQSAGLYAIKGDEVILLKDAYSSGKMTDVETLITILKVNKDECGFVIRRTWETEAQIKFQQDKPAIIEYIREHSNNPVAAEHFAQQADMYMTLHHNDDRAYFGEHNGFNIYYVSTYCGGQMYRIEDIGGYTFKAYEWQGYGDILGVYFVKGDTVYGLPEAYESGAITDMDAVATMIANSGMIVVTSNSTSEILPSTPPATTEPSTGIIETFYTVAGNAELCNGVSWDPASSVNKMFIQEDGSYAITYTNVPVGKHSFKVTTNGKWDIGDYNLNGDAKFGGANAEIDVTQDKSTVKITFNEKDGFAKCYINDVLVNSSDKPSSSSTGTVPIQTKPSPTTPSKPVVKAPKLSATKATFNAGAVKTLKVTDGKVKSWATTNKKVAVVRNGTVTGLNKGIAKITATLTNGKKLTCTVTVKTSPELNKAMVNVKKGKIVAVKLTGKASAINNKYTNTKIAKVNSKANASVIKIKGLKKGTTTLKIKVNGVKTLNLKVNVK